MRWDRFARGLKHLISKGAFPEGLAPESDPAVDGGAPPVEQRTKPYSPDNRNQQNESSLHLSC